MYQEYQKIYHHAKLYQSRGYTIGSKSYDLVKNGFLVRYKHLANQLLDLYFTNCNNYLQRVDNNECEFNDWEFYQGNYSIAKLSIIFGRMDIFEYLLGYQFSDDRRVINLIDNTCCHGFDCINYLLQYYQFEYLHLLDEYLPQWIQHSFPGGGGYDKEPIAVCKKPLTNHQISLLIEFIVKCINIIKKDYYDTSSLDLFHNIMLNYLCFENEYVTIDSSAESILLFLYQTHIQNNPTYYQNISYQYYYSLENIMRFDKLLTVILAKLEFKILTKLICNDDHYPIDSIIKRIEYCFNIIGDAIINDNEIQVAMYCNLAIRNNKYQILDYLLTRFHLRVITIIKDCVVIYETLKVLTIHNVKIVPLHDNGTNESVNIVYHLDSIEQIEDYYQLFDSCSDRSLFIDSGIRNLLEQILTDDPTNANEHQMQFDYYFPFLFQH
jgi:hypothetical protein